MRPKLRLSVSDVDVMNKRMNPPKKSAGEHDKIWPVGSHGTVPNVATIVRRPNQFVITCL